MIKPRMTRRYSLTMGMMNFAVAFVLFVLSRLNAEAGWPTAWVAVLGPTATMTFLVTALAWLLDALRPGAMRRFVPRVFPLSVSFPTDASGKRMVPRPLPPTIGERLHTGAASIVSGPWRGLRRQPRD